MNERERQILILNGAGLLIGSILVGWPPMIAVHIMVPLLFRGALGRLRELPQ